MGDETELKLFVWTDFAPDYTAGLAFAVAHDETAARKRIILQLGYEPPTWGTLHVHKLGAQVVYSVSGGG